MTETNSRQQIAALCVASKTPYRTMPGVLCFDRQTDARTFSGGMPVVAHPPCRAWSAYCSHQAKPEPGEKELGPFCVEQVRECGGVLEHPAHSRLWDFCGLPQPGSGSAELWAMAVSQAWWGLGVEKNTWLLFSRVGRRDVPEMPFKLRDTGGDRRRWQVLSRRQRAATSPAFAEWLVEAARRTNTNTTAAPSA